MTVPTAVKALVLAVYLAPILTMGFTLIPVQWTVVSFVLLGGVPRAPSIRHVAGRPEAGSQGVL